MSQVGVRASDDRVFRVEVDLRTGVGRDERAAPRCTLVGRGRGRTCGITRPTAALLFRWGMRLAGAGCRRERGKRLLGEGIGSAGCGVQGCLGHGCTSPCTLEECCGPEPRASASRWSGMLDEGRRTVQPCKGCDPCVPSRARPVEDIIWSWGRKARETRACAFEAAGRRVHGHTHGIHISLQK